MVRIYKKNNIKNNNFKKICKKKVCFQSNDCTFHKT